MKTSLYKSHAVPPGLAVMLQGAAYRLNVTGTSGASKRFVNSGEMTPGERLRRDADGGPGLFAEVLIQALAEGGGRAPRERCTGFHSHAFPAHRADVRCRSMTGAQDASRSRLAVARKRVSASASRLPCFMLTV